MLGKKSIASFAGLLVLCAGCTLPCHPFDYNGPVYDGSGQCISNNRAGSILDNGEIQNEAVIEDQSVIEDTSHNVNPRSTSPGEYEGARQLLSVTDRKVGESEQSVENQANPMMAQPTRAMRR
jgi:hypothetical protein